MIPLIKREIVDNRHWVSMKEFMEIIAVGQTAPGAVAVNTATFVGYRMARYKGAIAAILGVSLPSFLVILAGSSRGNSCPFSSGIFYLFKGDFYRKTEYYSNRCSFSGSFMAKIAPSTCYSHL